jgi:hypothetical protein
MNYCSVISNGMVLDDDAFKKETESKKLAEFWFHGVLLLLFGFQFTDDLLGIYDGGRVLRRGVDRAAVSQAVRRQCLNKGLAWITYFLVGRESFNAWNVQPSHGC